MATLQDAFDYAELLNRELQLQSGEADVAFGIRAANIAKDHFEGLIAQTPGLLGDSIGTVTTSASTESTAFPSGLLRLDRLQYIDPGTSRPAWDLVPLKRAGGHVNAQPVPLLSSPVTSEGRPAAYWTDGSNIYWSPLPSATHTVRYYGFVVASDFSAASDTFPYPDIVRPAFGAFIAQVFRMGLDDAVPDLDALTQRFFGSIVATLSNFRRESASPPSYYWHHVV